MIHVKVEKLGDKVALVLDEEAQRLLGVAPGDTVGLRSADDGVSVTGDQAIERGKLFVERYIKTFEALAR